MGAPCLDFETWDSSCGITETYVYDAMNQRVRIDQGSTAREFVFNLSGQRTSIWDANTGNQIQGQVYWGGLPVEFYANGAAHFQHQDWQGTERMRTSYNGAVEATYKSLPYGDAFAAYGQDSDPYHFGMLDHDGETDTDHAQFRQYSPTQGRWMSPDPYDGSYDFSNPQSFNRYAYVMNNPLSAIDPSGLDGNPIPGGGAIGGCVGAAIDGGANPFADIGCALSIFGLFGGGPSFHGSLKPRPNAQPWDEYNIHYGPNIAGALGLPDAGCEFGACGGGPSSFGPGAIGAHYPTVPPQVVYWMGLINWAFSGEHTPVHGPWHYGNWCGQGGSGMPVDKTDFACMSHDYCYARNGLTYADNLNPFMGWNKETQMQHCNDQLCAATTNGTGATGKINTFFNWGGAFLFDCHQ